VLQPRPVLGFPLCGCRRQHSTAMREAKSRAAANPPQLPRASHPALQRALPPAELHLPLSLVAVASRRRLRTGPAPLRVLARLPGPELRALLERPPGLLRERLLGALRLPK
jgi:hypothetical protein